MMEDNPVKAGETLKIFTDGASRGNPGNAACSFVFVRNNEIIHKSSYYLGQTSNNVAEYTAIIKALEEAKKFTRWNIEIYSDSQLAINQINKKWRIKKDHLSDLCGKVYELSKFFNGKGTSFFQVSRNHQFIKIADGLANSCLDENCGVIK